MPARGAVGKGTGGTACAARLAPSASLVWCWSDYHGVLARTSPLRRGRSAADAPNLASDGTMAVTTTCDGPGGAQSHRGVPLRRAHDTPLPACLHHSRCGGALRTWCRRWTSLHPHLALRRAFIRAEGKRPLRHPTRPQRTRTATVLATAAWLHHTVLSSRRAPPSEAGRLYLDHPPLLAGS